MTVASIDIGTNTVLLLIAEVNLKTRQINPLLNEQRIPRIGKGLQNGGEIKMEKISSLMDVLFEYQNKIKAHKCDRVIVTATNALRIANNSREIISSIKKKFGLSVEVISGDQEAEFAYLGAVSAESVNRTSLVIDIGGGSTEIIFGEQQKILFRKSFLIGSVSATEKFLLHSPPSPNQVLELKNRISEIFGRMDNNFIPCQVIGIAGTVTTLACMIKGLKKFDENIVEKSIISQSEAAITVDKIKKMKAAEILSEYGEVLKGREDIIVAGAIILTELMKLLNINELFVSTRGIRYGAIAAEFFHAY